jgi:hypothetical protein
MSTTKSRAPRRGRRIMDPEAREAFKAQRHEEDRERMAAAVAELASSEGWRRYVESRARFHNYSFGNCLLIASQRPDATQVASYRTWQSFGRQVRKGERGIRILAPMVVGGRAKSERRMGGLSCGNSVGQQVAAGRTSYEEDQSSTSTRLLFKSVSVFDISQTDGDELPALDVEPITGDSHEDRLPMLEAFAGELGYRVEWRDLSDHPAGGWCNPGEQLIVADSSRPANARVRVMVHELAHALGVGYADYGRADAEVIVESVTWIVLGSLGLDTSGESIPYVAGWGDGDAEALKAHAKVVDDVASRLERALEVK